MDSSRQQQSAFIDKLTRAGNTSNYIELIANEIKTVSYQDITDEVIDKIDLNIVNIYIEFLANDIIEHKFIDHNAVKCSHDKLYILLMYYHPKLFEYIFSGNTIEEYNKHRKDMLKEVDNIITNHKELTTEHNERLVNVKRLLEMEPNTDILKMSALEFGYYFTWASYKKEFVDINKQQLVSNNTNDILAINIRWNNKHDDAIVMYNNVDDIVIPVLNTEMITKTKRFNTYPLVSVPTGPYSLYDKNMQPIDKLTTDKITIVFDYGNNHYTKLFIGVDEPTLNFANAVINRKIIPNYNKRLLHSIINRDVFLFLPSSCYEAKLDKQQLINSVNKLKKVVMESFAPSVKTTINNITSHKLINDIFPNKHDREIFKVYISYLYTFDNIDLTTVVNICQDYITSTTVY